MAFNLNKIIYEQLKYWNKNFVEEIKIYILIN